MQLFHHPLIITAGCPTRLHTGDSYFPAFNGHNLTFDIGAQFPSATHTRSACTSRWLGAGGNSCTTPRDDEALTVGSGTVRRRRYPHPTLNQQKAG